MLKRYWFVLSPDWKYGSKNIGVTAYSIEQARKFVQESAVNVGRLTIQQLAINAAEVIEDIDVRILDKDHVIPNIGVVSRQGIWFPNLNSV